MIFSPREKLLRLNNPCNIKVSEKSIKFVKNLLKNVKKSITNKIFNLRKIRKYNIMFRDHFSIKDLHKRCRMLSLEQRMKKQLIWLMYIDSLNVDNRKICERDLRSADKYIFKVDRKIGTTYQRSPFYVGTLLWNDLNVGIQFSRDVVQFKQLVAGKYCVYEKLL